MSVHVGEVSSTVEVSPPAGATSGTGPAEAPLTPLWDDQERYQALGRLAGEAWSRTQGGGFDV